MADRVGLVVRMLVLAARGLSGEGCWAAFPMDSQELVISVDFTFVGSKFGDMTRKSNR